MAAAFDLESHPSLSPSPSSPSPSRLTALLGALDSVFQRPAATPAPVLLLESLRDELCRHFDPEQSSASLARGRGTAPWLGGPLDPLHDEHRELRAWSSELIQLARRSRSDQDAFRSLGVCFRLLRDFLDAHQRLRRLLEAHENTETQLRDLRHSLALPAQ
jgi:hypothetical protein